MKKYEKPQAETIRIRIESCFMTVSGEDIRWEETIQDWDE